MEWMLILALALLVPCVLMPVFFLWYLRRGGLTFSIRVAREKRRKPAFTTAAEAAQYESILVEDLKRYLETHPPLPE